MQNEVLNLLKERRSCRAFKSDQITVEEMEAVIEAGTWAANGKGLQSPIFIGVQDKKTRDMLSAMNAKFLGKEGFDPFYGAPTVICVLADASVPTALFDGSVAIGNMLTAAQSLGLGACWIHRCKQEFESEEGKKLLESLGIKGDYIGIGHCVLGHPAGEPAKAAERKEGRVFEIL